MDLVRFLRDLRTRQECRDLVRGCLQIFSDETGGIGLLIISNQSDA
jgi:hypothetical protein